MIFQVLTCLFASFTLFAATPRKPVLRLQAKKPAITGESSPFVRNPYVGALSADAQTGKILYADGADNLARPASVTKVMTALLVLEDIAAGKYSLTDRVKATEAAYKSEASWVGIKAGQSMTVDDLLMSLMVKSANDAAIVLGVNSAGSLEAFVARMNERAKELGMTKTKYYNPNGLPAPKYGKAFNVTTANDQLKLALEIIKHKAIFKYTSAKVATVKDGSDRDLSMLNHNRILRMDKYKITNPDGSEAVDGLKTGFIKAGGSSIILTGKRGNKRAIVVVLGSSSSDIREENASRLLVDALDALCW